MDSLTQIVLGAAVGEATLGKKIGNRAMMWGAIAGTIPDLDTLFLISGNEVSEMLYHRGISHSLFFALLFSLPLAICVNRYYSNGIHKSKWAKGVSATLGTGFIFISAVIFVYIFKVLSGTVGLLVSTLIAMGLGSYFIHGLWFKYFRNKQPDLSISTFSWYKLFFLGLSTHALLDAMTIYGTQLFLPFSNYRVALNNIAIIDPFYTIPFLGFLMAAAFTNRRSAKKIEQDLKESNFSSYKKRKWLNWTGIALSCIYLIWTIYNKHLVNKALEYTLDRQNISYQRYMTNPVIMTNFLWSGIVETEDKMYQGWYSIFDKEKYFHLIPIDKNHHLLDVKEDDKTMNTIQWFTKDFYAITKTKDGQLQLNDMRYGLEFSNSPSAKNEYIMGHIIKKDESGYYHLLEMGEEESDEEERQQLKDIWKRIKGEK